MRRRLAYFLFALLCQVKNCSKKWSFLPLTCIKTTQFEVGNIRLCMDGNHITSNLMYVLGIDKDGRFAPLTIGVGVCCPLWRNTQYLRLRWASKQRRQRVQMAFMMRWPWRSAKREETVGCLWHWLVSRRGRLNVCDAGLWVGGVQENPEWNINKKVSPN